ncbi:hypothetical protein OE88DRAFT_1811974 [Heliocybe sulcata]|uniref:Uncharacterized protein n=1 Tax=Heliocybe sulcata TaxID=5364 RepID=A0A5C3MLJ7_9AGAM|nr:hypothetical protein OE88DRAFT_1811974 [Heliocybe sulcata]
METHKMRKMEINVALSSPTTTADSFTCCSPRKKRKHAADQVTAMDPATEAKKAKKTQRKFEATTAAFDEVNLCSVCRRPCVSIIYPGRIYPTCFNDPIVLKSEEPEKSGNIGENSALGYSTAASLLEETGAGAGGESVEMRKVPLTTSVAWNNAAYPAQWTTIFPFPSTSQTSY